MRFLILCFFTVFSTISLFPQNTQKSFLTYYQMADFQQASPGAFKFGLYGFSNPAMNSYNRSPFDFLLGYNSLTTGDQTNERWGAFYGSNNVGFGMMQTNMMGNSVNDYRYSLAFGDKTFALGVGYGFVGGDKTAFGRSNTMHWGMLARPFKYLSFGLFQTYALEGADQETVAEIGIRPFGNYPLTLFADAATFQLDNFDDLMWSAGISWEFLDGIRVNARYFENERINVGFNVSLGKTGLAFQQNQIDDDNSGQTFFFRFGGNDRTIYEELDIIKYYVKMNLSGPIKYTRFALFDNSRILYDILNRLDEVRDNESIKGIVINTQGMQTSPAIAWEIRDKLKEIKEKGKEVVMFIERANYFSYYFASVGTKIVIDEMGTVSLPGFNITKSYYKNMLEKLNIGYEELRLFKYKSAAETFAREGFSEGDEEQLQRMIESWYETTRQDIVESRPEIGKQEFDDIVNGKISYFADEAIENGLVDTTGRWHKVDKWIEETIDDDAMIVNDWMLIDETMPIDDKWGPETNKIAVIYVLGVCAMESGINARRLVKDVEAAIKNDAVEAIVLRVDSPGGDALASEYIAKVVRDNKDKKPIIVSQGMVAASGGYWLSMDGDKILASPLTITGSIGVISSWIYDKGASEDLGITTDNVKIGKYADLGASFREPLLGLGLPTRNLTDDERKQFDDSMLRLYGDFVKQVADGRGMDSLEVHDVAQGRVWTGVDAKDKNLVDELGGLSHALKMARKEAGIDEDDDVTILQYPAPKLFDFGSLLGGMVGVNIEDPTERIQNVRYRLENSGVPMLLLPSEYWQIEEYN